MNRSKKALSLSLIIPAYNEERHIGACLDSVAAQTVKPLEVIVVDNNCIDRTVAIAAGYPFVRVIKEPVQGLIAARNRGFGDAKGDLIARIDCDARLPATWVDRVMINFDDPDLAAVTGPALNNLLTFLPWPRTRLWSLAYFMDTTAFFRVPILWGSNMAIRRSAWQTIKPRTSTDDRAVHEDQDISVLLAACELTVKRDNHLLMVTGSEQFAYLPKVWEYAARRSRTRRYHAALGTLETAQKFSDIGKLVALMTRLTVLPIAALALVVAIYSTIIQVIRRQTY